MDYLNSLGQMAPPPAPKADPVVAAAQDIEASMQRVLADEPAPEEDTKELPDLDGAAPAAAEAPVSLYQELTKARAEAPREDPEPAESESTRRIDFDHLQFG